MAVLTQIPEEWANVASHFPTRVGGKTKKNTSENLVFYLLWAFRLNCCCLHLKMLNLCAEEDDVSLAVSSMTESCSSSVSCWSDSLPATVNWRGVILRVFEGGKLCAQSNAFTSAIQDLEVTPTIEFINIDDVKRLKMNPKALIDWLLRSHAHFILSHFHQGTSSQNVPQMGWNMEQLQHEVQRLSQHNGFPSGEGVNCPIFTQNKGDYLSAVPDFVNPSLLVPLVQDGLHDYRSIKLER